MRAIQCSRRRYNPTGVFGVGGSLVGWAGVVRCVHVDVFRVDLGQLGKRWVVCRA